MNNQENQAVNKEQTPPKEGDKELNFRALQQKYERQLAEERAARENAERLAQERAKQSGNDDEEDDSEPYVDRKRLNKRLEKFGQQTREQTQTEIKKAVSEALYEERKQNWIKSNPDFYEIMQHAQKFAEKDPELAETILEMPDTFERQKLVYKNIKALGVHKPAVPESTIQGKIDAQRRNPYYQPSGVGTPGYSSQGDFSPSGQKNAYDKLQELKKNLRI